MSPNIQAIKALIAERFSGNKTRFAADLNINRSHVSMALNNDGKGVGAVFLGALIAFCEREGLDFHDYIFLPISVNKLTGEGA